MGLAQSVRAALRLLPKSVRDRLSAHLGKPDVRASLLQLRRFGFVPTQVLDVGAYEGEWTRTCLEVWPAVHVLCIEPQEAPQPALRRLAACEDNVTVRQALLGPHDASDVPFVEEGTGSSVLESTPGATGRPMWRIDTLVDLGLPPPDLIKLDVQGYELEVLNGFERHLSKCQVLQLELSLLAIAPGAPLMDDVIGYLKTRGFVMFDIDELIRAPSDGAVWQIDALFCKANSFLRSERRWR